MQWPGRKRNRGEGSGSACDTLTIARNREQSIKVFFSRSQALPGNAYREAPPPLLGAGAFAKREDFYRMRFQISDNQFLSATAGLPSSV